MVKFRRKAPVRKDVRVVRPVGLHDPADVISRLWYPLGFDRPERERRRHR